MPAPLATTDQRPRVRLASPTADPGDELPFRILVLADVAGRPLPAPLGERAPIRLGQAGLAPAIAALRPRVVTRTAAGLPVDLLWRDAEGLSPDQVIAQVPELAQLEQRRRDLLAPGRDPARRCAADVEAALIAERIDMQVATLLDLPEVRRLDAAWRSLALLAGHAGQAQGVDLAVLPVTRGELAEDLGDAPELAAAGLHRTLYADEYGQHGGRPWSLLVCDLAFTAAPQDLALLRRLAALGTIAHTPVLADAAPGLLGLADWRGLPAVEDVSAALHGPRMGAWQAWRGQDDARHVALVLPPLALRAPVLPQGDWLWGSAAMVLAARLADCHARTRWCADAAGAGPAAEVPVPQPCGFAATAGAELRPSAASLLSEDQARDLAEHGLTALCASRLRPAVAFPSIPSLHRADDPVPTQLPLVLIADRIAHHLKVLSRERLGGQVDRAGLERELADWLGRHIADGQIDDPALRAARPLRGATVRVHEVPGRAGWMRAELTIRPYLPGAGADVELALASRLDRGES
jgi:type VI secretion system protein ImpC